MGLRKARMAMRLGLLATACTVVSAQPASPFLGQWKVSWEADGRPQQAVLVVTDMGGTWKTTARSRNNPCIGLEVPITFVSGAGNDAVVRLEFAKTLNACADVTIQLKRVDDKTVTGTRGSMPLVLDKQ